jgi:hypothetical protein
VYNKRAIIKKKEKDKKQNRRTRKRKKKEGRSTNDIKSQKEMTFADVY